MVVAVIAVVGVTVVMDYTAVGICVVAIVVIGGNVDIGVRPGVIVGNVMVVDAVDVGMVPCVAMVVYTVVRGVCCYCW